MAKKYLGTIQGKDVYDVSEPKPDVVKPKDCSMQSVLEEFFEDTNVERYPVWFDFKAFWERINEVEMTLEEYEVLDEMCLMYLRKYDPKED